MNKIILAALLLTGCSTLGFQIARAQVAPYVQSDINNQQIRINNDNIAINSLQQQLSSLQADLIAAQAQLSTDTATLPQAVNFDKQQPIQVNGV